MKIRKPLIIAAAFIVLAAVNSFGQQAPAKAPLVFTEKHREMALKYMNDTKADYIKELTGISDAQLNFRAGPDRWTIAEIAEHITVTEEALFGAITAGPMKPDVAKCENPFRVSDGMILGAVTNRTRRATAPEAIQPNGRWKTVPALLASFEKTRNATIDFMKNTKTDLRNVFGQSPFGTVDGVQQMLFMIGHSERHLAQLKEVKADPKYPTK
jgi:ribosomal protein S18 acetylase RimI-like enzyme